MAGHKIEDLIKKSLRYKKLQEASAPKKEQITLRQYIDNPSGKGTDYLANRGAIKQALNLTFIKLLRESRKAFSATPYIYDNGDLLYHVKVPSEFYKTNGITYDVLFLLEHSSARRALRNITIFSNCPSFVYTYCYVYNKKGLLIDDFKDKLPDIALNTAPVIRNPIESMGYEKSTYIAARYLMDGFCLNDTYVNRYAKRMTDANQSKLEKLIADPETLVAIYQHAAYQQRKTHRKPLDTNTKAARDAMVQKHRAKSKKEANGRIFARPARSKITARKAKKSLLNN